jgi:hypothetical protein
MQGILIFAGYIFIGLIAFTVAMRELYFLAILKADPIKAFDIPWLKRLESRKKASEAREGLS